jgi:PAS domain S-box-containing protein
VQPHGLSYRKAFRPIRKVCAFCGPDEATLTKEELLKENQALKREIARLKAKGKVSRKKGGVPDGFDPVAVLQSVLDNTLSVIHIKDTEGRYIMVNRWFEKHTRFTREKLIGCTPYDLYPKEIVDVLLEADKRVINTKRPFEAEEEVPLDDGVHTFISAKYPVLDSKGKVRAVCGIATDITERKNTEEALKRSEASLKNAQRIARFGSWEWNVAKNELCCSDEIYRIFGVKKGAVKRGIEAFLDVMHPDDREHVQKAMDAALKGGEPVNVDYRVEARDGGVRLIHSEGEIIFDVAGDPLVVFGTSQDITDLRENELKYVDQLRFLQTLIDTIPSPIFYKDAGGRYLGCNGAFEKFIGLKRDEIEGKTVYGVAPKALADKYREMDLALLKKGGVQRYESKVRYADGGLRDILFSKAAFKNARGEAAGLVGVMLDVTDLKNAAAEKEQAVSTLNECREKTSAALGELEGVIRGLGQASGKKALDAGLKKARVLTKKLISESGKKK